mmetsp:Transcript_63433/g.95765  ORF Transcript_63433/g.95765 Transcript_63433/m.95765 type:complete len:537 (-) Transcript_63433:122-1732(-)
MASTGAQLGKDPESEASSDIQKILTGRQKPKHLGDGLSSGVGAIFRGAVGACGAVVLMPTVGAAHGTRELGVPGAVIGGVGGAVGGVVQAVNQMGGGLVAGVGQVVQGAVATPSAVTNPSKGKWWNANEGEWVYTNLLDEERWINTQPLFDEDILGEDVVPEEFKVPEDSRKKVKDMHYYDLLGLDPSVDSAMVKRRYYIIARKYSPDRCGANSQAQEEFNEIGHAYMVLMNAELREKYDRVGRKGLWKTESYDDEDVNPNTLYTFLFGSEKFDDYIGRLAAATAARVGEVENTKVSDAEARLLQRRRVTRLALKLADRLQQWAEDGLEMSAKANWTAEAEILSKASYGVDLVQVIGKLYSLSAVQFLGSIESGIGMPSIRNWAKRQSETMKVQTKRISTNIQNLGGNAEKKHLNRQVGTAIDKSEGDADLEEMAKDILKKSHLQRTTLQIMWTETVMDISNTLYEVVRYVMHDHNVTAEVRKKRAEGLVVLGEIFENATTDSFSSEQKELEEVAFHAMLDTVWRQETDAREHRQS